MQFNCMVCASFEGCHGSGVSISFSFWTVSKDYLFKATDDQQMWVIINSRVFSFKLYGGLRP